MQTLVCLSSTIPCDLDVQVGHQQTLGSKAAVCPCACRLQVELLGAVPLHLHRKQSVYAIHGPNAATELAMLATLQALTPSTLPILPALLSPNSSSSLAAAVAVGKPPKESAGKHYGHILLACGTPSCSRLSVLKQGGANHCCQCMRQSSAWKSLYGARMSQTRCKEYRRCLSREILTLVHVLRQYGCGLSCNSYAATGRPGVIMHPPSQRLVLVSCRLQSWSSRRAGTEDCCTVQVE